MDGDRAAGEAGTRVPATTYVCCSLSVSLFALLRSRLPLSPDSHPPSVAWGALSGNFILPAIFFILVFGSGILVALIMECLPGVMWEWAQGSTPLGAIHSMGTWWG